jgi:hypothetical protein
MTAQPEFQTCFAETWFQRVLLKTRSARGPEMLPVPVKQSIEEAALEGRASVQLRERHIGPALNCFEAVQRQLETMGFKVSERKTLNPYESSLIASWEEEV